MNTSKVKYPNCCHGEYYDGNGNKLDCPFCHTLVSEVSKCCGAPKEDLVKTMENYNKFMVCSKCFKPFTPVSEQKEEKHDKYCTCGCSDVDNIIDPQKEVDNERWAERQTLDKYNCHACLDSKDLKCPQCNWEINFATQRLLFDDQVKYDLVKSFIHQQILLEREKSYKEGYKECDKEWRKTIKIK